jgi:hypothetical protein
MDRAARAFYARYYLLTVLLPPYVMALLFYTTAWLLSPASPLSARGSTTVFFGFGFLVFIGVSRLLSALGFWLSGIPQARVAPTADDLRRLHDCLLLPPDWGSGRPSARGPDATELLVPALIELGPVPYLAAGGLDPRQLWISTCTLRSLEPVELRYLVAHEYAHVLNSPRGCGCAWPDLLWLVAYPLSWWLAGLNPGLIAAAGLLHALLWLRISYALRLRDEVRADAWAAEHLDRQAYARALADYHRRVYPDGPHAAMRYRLRKLGLDSNQIEELLKAD